MLPALILTYGDVETINAEGGTPTLPKAVFFGVSFHGSGTLRSPLCLFNLASVPLVSCGCAVVSV